MIEVAVGLLVGLVVGATFFGGLWWTVRQTATSNVAVAPLNFLLSYLVRLALVAAGLYLISGLGWQSMVACGVGIVLVRTMFVALMRGHLSASSKENGPA